MKLSLLLLISSFSFSVFGQALKIEGILASSLSQSEITALRENPCVDGGRRIKTETGFLEREYVANSEFIGVTSFGDVAVLKNNKTMVVYACPRGTGVVIGNGPGVLKLEDAGVNCSTGEILSYTLIGAGNYNFFFRSPRFTQGDSLCFNGKPNVNGSDRDAQKDAISSSSSSTGQASRVSQE